MTETEYHAIAKEKGYFEGMRDLFRLHDHGVLLILTAVYAGQGIRVISSTSAFFYFKDILKITDESEAQVLLALVYLPWYIKPVFGFLADSVPAFGSHRKSYLLLSSILGILAWMSFLFPLNLTWAMAMLLCAELSQVVSDIIADALMVEQSRTDKENGSSFLQTYSWSVMAAMGLVSGVCGGLASHYGVAYSTIMCCISVAPLLTLVATVWYVESTKSDKTSVKESISCLCKAISEKLTFRSLFFLYILETSLPGISKLMNYYVTNELKITPDFIYLLGLLSGLFFLFGSYVFSQSLKSWSFRQVFSCGQVCFMLTFSANLLLIFRWNLIVGISDKVFLTLTTFVTTMLIAAFYTIPMLVLTAQLCPPGLEATMYTFITSAINLGSFVSELIGAGVASLIMSQPGDYSQLHHIVLIELGIMTLPLCLLWLLPTSSRSSQ